MVLTISAGTSAYLSDGDTQDFPASANTANKTQYNFIGSSKTHAAYGYEKGSERGGGNRRT